MSALRLVAVGDIGLSTRNGRAPFEPVQPLLNDKDILFGNLETVLSKRVASVEKAVSLGASPDNAIYLKQAGFDVVSVANNHVMDSGVEGLNDTLDTLHGLGVKFSGARTEKFDDTSIIVERGTTRVGFLSYYVNGRRYGNGIEISRLDETQVSDDIVRLKQSCDYVVVSLHWGIEKVFYPAPDQISMARGFIEAGATLILGHHPHVVQGVERYKHGLIAYSLGNFQFQLFEHDLRLDRRQRTDESFILSVTFEDGGVKEHRLTPIEINGDFVPVVSVGHKRQALLDFVDHISGPIKNGTITEKWWFEQIADEYLYENGRSFIIRIRKYGVKHLVMFMVWLITPFVLKCYRGWLGKRLRGKK